MRYYERRLPHFSVVGQPLFVTFQLHGSLPQSRVFPPERLTDNGRAFVAMDGLLDCGKTGPLSLVRPEIARLVVAALQDGERRFHRYQLHAYVVMPNHVHVLATPHVATPRWLGPLKGFTAYSANRILGTSGLPFWQDESYDHLVGDGQFDRIRHYIEWNPVRAGLAIEAGGFPWSSANLDGANSGGGNSGGGDAALKAAAARNGLPHCIGGGEKCCMDNCASGGLSFL